ncbi:hypothetical protein DFQ05_1705 [Winogradskyella wandonensis]|uniref:Uncharacterized protein n=1 Tax=Winogradskyella wandonensis TaxID=1442586 RepID=A0A4R1KSA9_9FLAO|nr:hypothetical protein [Winogradskyella wandonensis]TCK67922.1 hypothetical protein DFQ05_1705 [Winogradskyella wandonensis]
MKKSLLEKLVILVEEQVEKAETEKERTENIQLLKELTEEQKNKKQNFSDHLLWSLLKNLATHEAIEAIKSFLSG